MTIILHTKTEHHYIIDDVEIIEIQTEKGLEGEPIPEEEQTRGFIFNECK